MANRSHQRALGGAFAHTTTYDQSEKGVVTSQKSGENRALCIQAVLMSREQRGNLKKP